MSMPLQQQPPPPPFAVVEPSYHSHDASVGPVIGVLVVIVILGILAGMIGRICTGRRIMGYGQYDVESWMERKFSTCIDGRISLATTPPAAPAATGVRAASSSQEQSTPEEQSAQHQAPSSEAS